MKVQHEEMTVRLEMLADFLLDGFVLTIFFIITLGIAALLVFRLPPRTTTEPRPFAGKIVEKRISVYESQQGSSFVNDLIIEEPNGRRFKFGVPEELYARAQVGLCIRRDKKGIELFPCPAEQPAG